MGDQGNSSNLSQNSKLTIFSNGKKSSQVASVPKAFHKKAFNRPASRGPAAIRSGVAGDVALFLLKVVALETVRKFSNKRCPFAWRGVQALQVLCYPPLKWIQRWAPFKGLVKGIKMFSRPLLVLSVATAFSDQPAQTRASIGLNDSHACFGPDSESSPAPSSIDTRTDDKEPEHLPSENWLLNINKELENQGISLPERINENELHRFYTAANGDFSRLLATVKKTIRWRETYKILSEQELEMWSNLVFWHGYDVNNRSCLIVRLGLACTILPTHERPQFAQAVVSQLEYGILHFVDEENPQIMVLVDCEGLSPIRLPMQMLRSCSALFQDHFPYRLGCLFVIRLPPIIRVIARTYIQVLKPDTRQKVKFVGVPYQRVLSEYIKALPAYLGGKCPCMKCSSVTVHDIQTPRAATMAHEITQPNADTSFGKYPPAMYPTTQIDNDMDHNCDQVLRTAIISILMIWAFIALVMGIYDPNTRPFQSP
ncbi:hypothetical protein Nepgr_014602 [Nepenthes gracilis]|uniref:CRAL-TRIO domain-containing protein n=1 Tax=Nepenthes gracilis TaxID=150966 RepID=A0AAD3SM50_NEPGR|nr:hypothetical protein Nepgr_014602 [Nepenthes gracilis]